MMMGITTQLLYTGEEFIAELSEILVWIISIVGVLMVLYAVYIGYLFATATDEGKRRAAKSRLFKILSSVLIIYALAACIKVINVSFDDVEISKEDTDNAINWAEYEYEYIGSVSPMYFKKGGYANGIELDPTKLRMKSGELTLKEVKFTGFVLDPESDVLQAELNALGTQNVKLLDTGGLKYTFGQKSIANETVQDAYTITSSVEVSGSHYIRALVSFNYKEKDGCTLEIMIKVSSDTELIVIL
ncbi:MAG: hypothetical protein J6B20_01410 [Clostridia bacterium]|nr:hypothetical protein [Clostridia bacterium]